MMPTLNRPSNGARGLGYGGLVPFVGLALATVFLQGSSQTWAGSALLAYSASILTFVGALHWGMTMRDATGPRTELLVWGVIPSLVAWVAMLLPISAGLIVVTVLLWACLLVDSKVYPTIGLQAWLPMRLQLTAVASVCCLTGAALMSRGTP